MMVGFDQFKLNKQLLNAVSEAGYESPTPVQKKVIPRALGGADIIGIAQTGTGKTAAYLLPILMKLKYAQDDMPRAVIFTPTRELALQVSEVADKLSAYTDLRTVVLYGGLGPKKQIEELEKGCDLIVSTSGRFLDLYRKGHIPVKNIKMLILDEADRMMDMGFMPQIRNLLEILPRKRQNLLFSATFSPKVENLSSEFLEFPEKIEITKSATPAELVTQELYRIPNFRTKIEMLEYLYSRDAHLKKVLVFSRKRTTADNIFKFLDRKKISTVRVIHANKGQNSRINAVRAFDTNEIQTLVSTDVSARGMDIKDVSHVINFDVPVMYEDYVHRIGRTGRAMKVGKAITFVAPHEDQHISEIEKLIGQNIPERKIPKDLMIHETPVSEKQEMEREIDRQKRKKDDKFQGAFHEKKKKYGSNIKKRKK